MTHTITCVCKRKQSLEHIQTIGRYSPPYVVSEYKFSCICGASGTIAVPHKDEPKKKKK